MTNEKIEINKIVSKILKYVKPNVEFQSIFNVQVYGNHANIGGEIAVINENSVTLINDNENLIFKIFTEIEPHLLNLQKKQGNNHNGNMYIKIHAFNGNDVNVDYYTDNNNNLEIENYILWQFDDLNYIKKPNSKFTVDTLKKFNRIK